MSKRFDITITETLQMTLEVEAMDKMQAEQIAANAWRNCEYVLTADNFAGVEFTAVAKNV